MVHEIIETSLRRKLKKFLKSPFFIPTVLLFLVVASLPIAYFLSTQRNDIRSRAASTPTASIEITPATATYGVGEQFSVSLVIDGKGQAFNAAQANVNVSNNLTINSIALTSPSSGGCNFTFVNQGRTPKLNNPSFTGAILNGSSQKCTLYTMTLTTNALGSGTITIGNSSVKAFGDNGEILLSTINGSYTISSITPIPTLTVTPTPIAPKSDLTFSPSISQVNTGNDFAIQMRVNTNGQLVNAVSSDISYPSALLDVVSVTNTNGAFSIEVINNSATPGNIDLAFGTLTPKSGDLLIATIVFRAKAAGIAPVSFIGPVVTNSTTNTDDLKSFTNGSYTIIGSTLTPTPTAGVSATPTTVVPTATVAPTSIPTATPTTAPNAPEAPTVDAKPTETYQSAFVLTGTKVAAVTQVLVNNSSSGVNYPTTTDWQFSATLSLGNNTFTVAGRDSNGLTSTSTSLSISLHRLGDIDGDNLIDLTDVSMFGTDWENTGTLNHILSDMNGDNIIDLTDFSVLAKVYGN